jgi:hypothetical protein
MKLKGHTVIELTDAASGTVEKVEADNMVTDAINQAFGLNPLGMMYRANIETSGGTDLSLNKYLVPICPVLTCGLMLFHDELQEDAGNMFPPQDNLPFATAGDFVNATTNTAQGSYNANESGQLSNGYRYVWDFTTSQGNGTIAALALTTPNGGRAAYGDKLADSYTFLKVKTSVIGYGTDFAKTWDFITAVELDWEKDYIVTLSYSNSKVWIRKIRVASNKIGLLDTLGESVYDVLEEKSITPAIFSFSGSNGIFLDGMDGYWYGFRNAANTSGSATVYWIRIAKQDYSFTEGTWTLPTTYLAVLGTANYATSSASGMAYSRNCCIRGGYLYALRNGRAGVYKINLNNSADITYLAFPATGSSNAISLYSSCSAYFQLVNNIIFGTNFYILEDDTIVQTYGTSGKISGVCSVVFQNGMYLVGYGPTVKVLYMVMPFLATINNLDSPVEKTADKTMKITYTLTQEE